MRHSWGARTLLLAAALSLLVASGCGIMWAGMTDPERQHRRAYTIRTDLDRIWDDVDWMLGLHRPTPLYDETIPW